MKKGRHRRFEEARALKRTTDLDIDIDDVLERVPAEPCEECGAEPGKPHATWCLAEQYADDEDEPGP